MAALASIHRNCAQQLVPSTSTGPSFLRLALSSNPSLSPSPSLAHSLLRSVAAHTGLLPAARTSLAAPSLLRTSFAFQLPSLASLFPDSLASLRELLPPWVLAVPKSKTSHSKKAMRSSNKGLKEQQAIVACPSCGTPKRSHHICHDCHVDYRQEYHQEAKHAAAGKRATV